MKVKLILPALLEATDPGFRPIKYALFPPLGLVALAGYLDPDDEVTLEDEHVMPITMDDRPDLVVMSVYITSARRAYRRAYRRFYAWGSIFRGAAGQRTAHQKARHLAYAGGWKRLEPLWHAIVRSRRVSAMLPLLETTLDAFGRARGVQSLPVPTARKESRAWGSLR